MNFSGLLRGIFLAIAAVFTTWSSGASAQVQPSGRTIPLALAIEAAQEAVRDCSSKGYRISAAVLDTSGVERVVMRADHSTIHTREVAFRKAYTIVTLGPIFSLNTTSALTEKISKTPIGPPLSSVSNVILLSGGVALRSREETIGALGVDGAPAGAFDEQCAQTGVARIQERLDAL